MRSGVTAVVLSARPYTQDPPDGCALLVRVGEIRTPAELLDARFAAVVDVQTDRFFFLDDDDELPDHFPRALAMCLDADAPLAYTDEVVRRADGDEIVREGRPYSQDAHLADPQLVHHLTLCRTAEALAAIPALPRGHFAPELLLYWQMAKVGAVYVPITGYVWNRAADGMSTWPQTALSQMRAALWCQAHR